MKTKITLLVLTILLGLTNVFANSVPSSENIVENEIMTTSDNSIIISAGKRIYTLNMNTYQATLLATSPYVNEINSIASDNTTGWIFYVSNHISSYNWTIYGYNVYTNTHKNFGSVRHFFTSTGHAYSSRGLASGGATFYNGKLYFAMEYPVNCYYYRDGGRVSNNANPKDELSDNTRAAGTVSSSMFTNGPITRNSTATEADEVDNGGRTGNGETPADFVIIEAEEANLINDNVSDYIPEEDLPSDGTSNDDTLQQRGTTQAETDSYNYYNSTYNNNIYLLEISFSGLSDTSGQTTSVANGRPVYDPWGYSSFLYKGELGDIVVDDNGQMYASTSYQVQAYNFNTNRYDWANNEDVYAQMAKDKNSNLQLLKNKRQCSTTYYNGCPHTTCTTKSFVQSYTAPSSLRTYNSLQLGSLNEISGLDPYDVGKITDASDYICLTPPVSYRIKGFVFDDNNENGNYNGGQGETKTPGITITLYADNNNDGVLDSGDTVIETQVTNSNGHYTFSDVQVANTLVKVTVPTNTSTTTYTLTTAEVIAVTGSEDDVTGIKFGINEEQVINYNISGTVYDDNDENGAQDPGEADLASITVTLYNDANGNGAVDAGETAIASTTSGADGTYSFANVTVENTVVAVTVPSNTGDFTYTLTTAGVRDTSSTITDVTEINFGINKEQVIDYNISGVVFDDDNENGTQDAGEANLTSVTVTLYNDANGNGAVDAGETAIASTTSGADGTYSFTNVTVENTVVAVTVPSNTSENTYVLTTASEVNTSSTTTNVTADFGINEEQIINYNISGTVFDDDNANGSNDSEAGLGSLTMSLYSDNDADGTLSAGDGFIGTTTTASDGTYSFANVTVENTLVAVTVPSNTPENTYTATTPVMVAVSSTITDVTDVDFGINKVQIIDYNISGTVFDDDNANGSNDSEVGLGSLTMSLYSDNDADGTLSAGDGFIGTTTTESDGTYSFANVTVENTLVAVTVPSNTSENTYTATTPVMVAVSSTITDVTDVDFGINKVQVIDYNISGTVFDDDNANGTIDAAEAGRLENITLTLYADNDNNGRVGAGDTVISTTTSAANGTYSFSNVTTQNTLVAVTVPTNTAVFTYVLTTSAEVNTSSTTTDVTGVDFGINREEVINYNISGTVFDDDNANGIIDAAEAGRLENVTLTLYADNDNNGRVGAADTVISTTTSAADGTYGFSNVTTRNTLVVVTVPTNGNGFNYTLTTSEMRVTSSTINDVTNVNFGINRTSSSYAISGNVFNDVNADGDNTSDSGLSGVTVRLYNDLNQNGIIDRGEPLITSTISDRNGNYQFTGLTDIYVVVQVVVPANTAQFQYLATTAINVPLSSGLTANNVNFGIQRTAVVLYNIRGVVWNDTDEDQIKDLTELRLEGIAVTLYNDVNGNGVIDTNDTALSTLTTSVTGVYEFTNVNIRNVIIKPTVPSSGTLTTPGERAISSINTNVNDVDFGIKITVDLFQITGVVWDDDNENGVIDPGEGSLDGLSVEVYADTDGSGTYDPNFDALIAFTQTNNSGFGITNPNYLIDDLTNGLVHIVLVVPEDNPPFESYTITYDPDSGTANPDAVYTTLLNTSITGVNFGLNYINLGSTSRDVSSDDTLFTDGNTISQTVEDVSDRLRLYPNPTVDQIAINAEEFAGDVTVEIYNDRGYKVITTTVSPFGGEVKVDVQRLSPGMYYAKFGSKNTVASKKFIKK